MAVNLFNQDLKAPRSTTTAATLVLLCKRPLAGQGKQRLAATFGAEETLFLAEGFLHCALEDLMAWPGAVVLVPASQGDRDWAEQLISALAVKNLANATVVPQHQGNLGHRIIELDRQLLKLGHQRRVYIGSDAPILSPRHYQQVLNQLGQAEVVLSSADDGGVTIMATTAPWPAALTDLPWSTDRLGQALADCCRDQGLTVGYIEPSYDIDFEVDLTRLQIDLEQDQRPARQQLLQRLQTLFKPDARTGNSNRAESKPEMYR